MSQGRRRWLPLNDRIASRNATAVNTTTTTLSRFIKIGDSISHLADPRPVLFITTLLYYLRLCVVNQNCSVFSEVFYVVYLLCSVMSITYALCCPSLMFCVVHH